MVVTPAGWSALVLAGLFVASGATAALGLATAGPPSAPLAAGAVVGPAPAATGFSSVAPPPLAGAEVGSPQGGGDLANTALAQARAAGVPLSDVILPRPPALPSALALANATGRASPLYTGLPAPIGLVDYGLRAGPRGAVDPYLLNTTSIQGTADFNGTGVRPMDLYQTHPDAFTVQLNAVLTYVPIDGNIVNRSSGVPFEFFTQDVALYYPGSHVMFLVSNIWNFSDGPIRNGGFYEKGGRVVGTTFYYDVLGPFNVTYPFNLTLTLVSYVSHHRETVDFDAAVASAAYPLQDFDLPFDTVVFNSLGGNLSSVSEPANYTADGFAYDPVGLTNDFELTFGGPGGGSQADLFAADATLGLAYADDGSYVAVPSAYSYGGATGETVTGANVAWSSLPGGPSGLGTYGTMTTGPSVLRGLWNASTPAGTVPLTVAVSPSNAFTFVTPTGGAQNFTIAEAGYAPGVSTNTFWLSPGNYTVRSELSGYVPRTTEVVLSGATSVDLDLVAAPWLGVYTPLWAFANAQLPALATRGDGAPADPYVLVNAPATIGPEFGLYNDYGFPVFPGVFLYGTTASVELLRPPSFEATTNVTAFPGAYLPSRNALQYWFWNVSNAAIVDASNISGWFANDTFDPTVFNTFNVVLYNSSRDLIAGNRFATQGDALLAFEGGSLAWAFGGPANLGGGNNTVWGNTFVQVAAPEAPGCETEGSPTCRPPMPFAWGLGLELDEPNDLLWNNYVGTPTTAAFVPYGLASLSGLIPPDRWNVTPQPASDVLTLPNFPGVELSGSIVGTVEQGGNFWWDYGSADSPYTGGNNTYQSLPYRENVGFGLRIHNGTGSRWDEYCVLACLLPGGDEAPLSAPLYPVQLESNVPKGTLWGATVKNRTETFDIDRASPGSRTVWLPNGTYTVAGSPPPGFRFLAPETFRVHGRSSVVTVRFHRYLWGVTVHERGLAPGTRWTVTVNGTEPATYASNRTVSTDASSIVFELPSGTYNYSVAGVPGEVVVTHEPRTFAVRSSAVTIRLRFQPVAGPAASVPAAAPTVARRDP